MHNNAALTRTLLFVIPIAAFAAYGFAGLYVGLSVVVASIIVLVLRRRSLSEAIVGSRRGRWWTWTLAGVVMIGSSVIAAVLSGEFDELRWILFSLLFFGGVLIVGASIVRAIALRIARPSTPAV